MILDPLMRLTFYPRYLLSGVTYRMSGLAPRLQSLRNKYAGQPMLVVGNGPSLNRTPLDKFAGVPSIGMNKIDLLFPRTTWRPSLIIVTNNIVVKQHAMSFAESDIPVYVSWKARWFIPRHLRKKVAYYYTKPSSKFSTDIKSGAGTGTTVTYAALQFAYYMGADPVILFGVDHSFSKVANSIRIERREGPDSDHFDPNYFASGTFWGLPDLDANEVAYLGSRRAFEKDERKILDATIDGKLQVFDKISVDEALRLCGRA